MEMGKIVTKAVDCLASGQVQFKEQTVQNKVET